MLASGRGETGAGAAMIRHIVMFGARAPEHVDEIVRTLSGYGAIEDVETIEVRRSEKLDPGADEVDVVLHATFASREALARYKAHPIYEAGTARVRPLRTIRHVADYEA